MGNEEVDKRGVSPDISCHTTLCIRCNFFEQCRFSSQEARDIRRVIKDDDA